MNENVRNKGEVETAAAEDAAEKIFCRDYIFGTIRKNKQSLANIKSQKKNLKSL